MKVSVSYTFIFEPTETWQRASDFDSSLLDLFRQMGYSVENIENTENKNLILLSKTPESVSPTLPQSTKQEMQRQTQKRGFDGQFKKADGR